MATADGHEGAQSGGEAAAGGPALGFVGAGMMATAMINGIIAAKVNIPHRRQQQYHKQRHKQQHHHDYFKSDTNNRFAELPLFSYLPSGIRAREHCRQRSAQIELGAAFRVRCSDYREQQGGVTLESRSREEHAGACMRNTRRSTCINPRFGESQPSCNLLF